jgi:hypothetical protein
MQAIGFIVLYFSNRLYLISENRCINIPFAACVPDAATIIQ